MGALNLAILYSRLITGLYKGFEQIYGLSFSRKIWQIELPILGLAIQGPGIAVRPEKRNLRSKRL